MKWGHYGIAERCDERIIAIDTQRAKLAADKLLQVAVSHYPMAVGLKKRPFLFLESKTKSGNKKSNFLTTVAVDPRNKM